MATSAYGVNTQVGEETGSPVHTLCALNDLSCQARWRVIVLRAPCPTMYLIPIAKSSTGTYSGQAVRATTWTCPRSLPSPESFGSSPRRYVFYVLLRRLDACISLLLCCDRAPLLFLSCSPARPLSRFPI